MLQQTEQLQDEECLRDRDHHEIELDQHLLELAEVLHEDRVVEVAYLVVADLLGDLEAQALLLDGHDREQRECLVEVEERVAVERVRLRLPHRVDQEEQRASREPDHLEPLLLEHDLFVLRVELLEFAQDLVLALAAQHRRQEPAHGWQQQHPLPHQFPTQLAALEHCVAAQAELTGN